MSDATDWTRLQVGVHRLRPRNKVRIWVEAMISAGGPTGSEFDEMLSGVRGRTRLRWPERTVLVRYAAICTAAERRSDTAAALSAVMRSKRRGRPGRYARFIWRSIVLGWLVLGAMWYAFGPIPSVTLGELWVDAAACGVVIGVPLSAGMLRYEEIRLDWLRGQALAALADLSAPEGLDAVAGAVGDRSPTVREAARQALIPLLGAATEGQCELARGVVSSVCELLTSDDWRLVGAAIEWLGRLGDGRAVAPLETFAQSTRAPIVLRNAAERVLPALRERKQQERDASRLLRPSNQSEDGSSLLRPAASTAPGDELRLLRAAGEEEVE